jgi:hypothetical protein
MEDKILFGVLHNFKCKKAIAAIVAYLPANIAIKRYDLNGSKSFERIFSLSFKIVGSSKYTTTQAASKIRERNDGN